MFYESRVGGPDPAPVPWPPGSGGGPPPSGSVPDVCSLLSGVDVEALDDEACLAGLEALDRHKSQVDALRQRLLARFAALRPPDKEGVRHPCEFAADEVAAATRVSTPNAAGQVSDALVLTTRLPVTLAALAAGTIDLARARAAVEVTAGLTDAQASEVDRAGAAKGPRGSHTLFRRALRRLVQKVDPKGAERRRKAAEADRDVRIDTRLEDGVAGLCATLPAAVALAVYATLDRLARSMPPGDPRTLAQRRADILADLVLGRHPHRTVAVNVNVTVAASTLAGLDDQPGNLHGYGTITAEHARELARDATWRRILFDPVDRDVIEVAHRRHPSPALVRHVRARNRRCVFPGCSRAAESCDTDHTVPYGQRGPTTARNLGPLCRHHHRLKDEGPWTLEQPTPGRFVWTSPTGRMYTVLPNPHDDD